MAAKSFTGGDKLRKHLDQLAKNIGRGAVLKVGFFEGATEADGQPTPMVAALNEFGVPSRGQPPRPYFRGMIAENKGHWGDDIGKLLKRTDYDAMAALQLMGEEIKGELVESIHALTDPPLAESTIARKGFDKPLIDSGDMWKNVASEVESL